MKSWNLNFLEPSGSLQACNATALPLHLLSEVAVLNMSVFCSSLTSCFPGMLLTYFLNNPSCPYYYWHHLCFYIPHALSLYFRILSVSFLITFLFPEIATSINVHVPFPLSWIMMSGLLLGIVLSVCTYYYY